MTVTIHSSELYHLITIDLSEAHTQEEIYAPGYRVIRVYQDGDLDIAFDEKDNPYIPLKYIADWSPGPQGFKYLYITNSAQSGKKVILLVGRTKEFLATAARIGSVGILNASDLRINPSTEDTLQSILNNIGDAGSSPSNISGYTLLFNTYVIWSRLETLFGYWRLAELLTSTPLSANAEYVSSVWDMNTAKVGYLEVMVFTDVDGTLYVEQSWDNENWDYSDSWSVTGGTPLAVKVQIVARYVRIRYVNGGTDQSVFRLGRRISI